MNIIVFMSLLNVFVFTYDLLLKSPNNILEKGCFQ